LHGFWSKEAAMPDEEQELRAALEELERELDRMMNIGEVQQANALVAAICAGFAIETARIGPAIADTQR
jgi:hypothetical protein